MMSMMSTSIILVVLTPTIFADLLLLPSERECHERSMLCYAYWAHVNEQSRILPRLEDEVRCAARLVSFWNNCKYLRRAHSVLPNDIPIETLFGHYLKMKSQLPHTTWMARDWPMP